MKASLTLLILLLAFLDGLSQKQLNVHPGDSIQEKLNSAASGDTIVFESGIYEKVSLRVDKELHLRGKQDAVLVGADTGSIVQIVHSNVSISGLEFQKTPISFIREYAAIEVIQSKNIYLYGNRFKDNFFAVYLSDSEAITIKDNHIHASNERESNSGNAIHAWKSKNIHIENNYLSGHRDGVYLEFARNVHVKNNVSTKNLRYGLHFMFSDSCTYEGNRFEDNGAGVAVMYSKFVSMHHNTFIQNKGANTYGLLLKEIFDSEMAYNLFYDNTIAIYLEASNRVNAHHNTFEKNGWAIKLKANSISNRFEKNNFMGNVFDLATNSRQNYNELEGNYWSQFNGYDLDNNGIGDTAYRPARLFGALIDKQPLALLLVHSQFAQLLDWVDAVMPILTPESLKDKAPRMKPIAYDTH
jgi:nitrous oxidase accessory protein